MPNLPKGVPRLTRKAYSSPPMTRSQNKKKVIDCPAQQKIVEMDRKWLSYVIELSRKACSNGAKEHPFAAVLVHNDEKLMEAVNEVVTKCDSTRHAEVVLCSMASRRAAKDPEFKRKLETATFYSSTEPCIMSSGAIYWLAPHRLVYACSKERMEDITDRARNA